MDVKNVDKKGGHIFITDVFSRFQLNKECSVIVLRFWKTPLSLPLLEELLCSIDFQPGREKREVVFKPRQWQFPWCWLQSATKSSDHTTRRSGLL